MIFPLGLAERLVGVPIFANPESYELWMGRWSTQLAPRFVDFADLPAGGYILDVGSGTGARCRALIDRINGVRVVGVEPAVDYVAYTQERLADTAVEVRQGDALALHFEDHRFDGALALLILQELPNALQAVQQMRRVTRPGGLVATCQWNFIDGLPMLSLFWEAAVEVIDTHAARQRAKDCTPLGYSTTLALCDLWESAGLSEIETCTLEISMGFANFEDYWGPFQSDVTQSSSYANTLSEDERSALKDRLYEKVLGSGPDRPFMLPAQACAVKGIS
jgi:SAM-dependent methyltransferase